MTLDKPATRPVNPRFSSGPCAKPPIHSLDKLVWRAARPLAPRRCRQGEAEGRDRDDARHPWRAGGLPHRHRPGLRHRRRRNGDVVDAGRPTLHDAAWESFGAGWVTDVVKQLKLDAVVKTADYGEIVDLAQIDFDTDVVFTWNGTTSGVRVPNGDAIPRNPRGPDDL
jgi:phosphoserine aminotransferase